MIEQQHHLAFIALGSNLEPRQSYIERAIERIRSLGTIEQMSAVLTTAPVGYTEQPDFLNAVLALRTQFAPLRLLRELREIERELGRQQRPRWHEREIDLDLLFWDDFVLSNESLTLPHPEVQNRLFVLQPLAEIAPNFVHPVLHVTIGELLAKLRDTR